MVVKWQPLGGISEILEINKKVSLPLVVSSALESAIGLNAGIWLACALDSGFDPGLGTSSLFVQDLVDDLPMEAIEITPNRDTMKKLEADEQTTKTWQQRLSAAYEELYSPE
jgi:O-succinylbenzoate synthase